MKVGLQVFQIEGEPWLLKTSGNERYVLTKFEAYLSSGYPKRITYDQISITGDVIEFVPELAKVACSKNLIINQSTLLSIHKCITEFDNVSQLVLEASNLVCSSELPPKTVSSATYIACLFGESSIVYAHSVTFVVPLVNSPSRDIVERCSWLTILFGHREIFRPQNLADRESDIITILTKVSALRSITMEHCYINRRSLLLILTTNAEMIQLRDCYISNEYIDDFVEPENLTVRELYCQSEFEDSSGVVAVLRSVPEIVILDLTTTVIDDNVLIAISDLKKLEMLDITWTRVEVTATVIMPQILYVQYSSHASVSIEFLEELFPNAKLGYVNAEQIC